MFLEEWKYFSKWVEKKDKIYFSGDGLRTYFAELKITLQNRQKLEPSFVSVQVVKTPPSFVSSSVVKIVTHKDEKFKPLIGSVWVVKYHPGLEWKQLFKNVESMNHVLFCKCG